MTTFALVHGAWHGSPCWEPTAILLREAGHRVVAPDLPCDDPDAGLDDYASVVIGALADQHPADDLVVVGHSMGGLTIPLVAAALPVRELVFLCALTPLPGASLLDDRDQLADVFAPEFGALSGDLIRHENGTTSWPTDGQAIAAFYHDCPAELAAQAAGQLRAQAPRPQVQPSPLRGYPDVPARAIVCNEDRVLSADACARYATERLGATVIRLSGGHSPMLAQPGALAALLLGEA